jgi:N,N'-diacetyllegionaminate synthase
VFVKADRKIIIIGKHKVGDGRPCFIIAEAGVNHNGSIELARELIDVAVQAQADAVKFQTFKPEKVCSPLAPKATYQLQTTCTEESQLEMTKKLQLPFGAFRELQSYCKSKNILFLSTPFDYESADFLAKLEVPAFKIPSGEITNLPLVEHIARKRRPLIVSTGMSALDEVGKAVTTIRGAGNNELVLLHCVSNYPAQPTSVNLRAMCTLAEVFGVPIGYSDHTRGIEVAIAATALGACVIEKHFTINRELPGPDHRASLDPDELAAMVRSIRNVEAALGDGIKRPASEEAETAAVARRSLTAARYIPAGTILTEELVAILRPGTGLAPAMRVQLVGRRTRQDIEAGTLLTLDMVA